VSLTLLLSLLSLLSIAFQTAPLPRVKYFRKLDLDRKQSYLTTYEIKGKDTARARCYRCTYDKSGRMVRWEYISARRPATDPMFGLHRIDITHSGNERRQSFFDERGNPTRAEGTGSYGTSQFAEIIRVFPSADSAVKILLNRNGDPMKADHDGCSYYTWKLDARGLRIRQACYSEYDLRVTDADAMFEIRYENNDLGDLIGLQVVNEDETLLSFTRIGYDSMRNRAWERFYRGDSTYNGERPIRFFSYDRDGNKIETAYYSDDEHAHSRETRTFDAFGNPLVERMYNAENVLGVEARNEYDERNLLIKQDIFEGGSQHKARVFRYYDDHGNEIERKYYLRVDGQLSLMARDVMSYDSLGFMTRYEHRDGAGAYRENEEGVALTVIERDRLGDVQEIRYYDAQGKYAVMGEDKYSIEKFFYHAGGEVDRVEFLSADRTWLYSE